MYRIEMDQPGRLGRQVDETFTGLEHGGEVESDL